jgi:uncharacterized protein YdeI (YjbR/CyaY-like superfamily)
MFQESEPVVFESRKQWEDWLEINHRFFPGIWLQIGRKNSGFITISYDEALEVALCYGWIDAIRKKYDSVSFIQRFTPRRTGSGWSRINRDKVRLLTEAGLMHPAGLAAVEEAKKNGNWEKAYEPQSTIEIPEDLQLEFTRYPKAHIFFETLDSRNRYAVLHRIQVAVKPETRAKRIKEFVAMLEAEKKLYP